MRLTLKYPDHISLVEIDRMLEEVGDRHCLRLEKEYGATRSFHDESNYIPAREHTVEGFIQRQQERRQRMQPND